MAWFAALGNVVQLFKLIRELVSLWDQAQREGWLKDSEITLEQIEKAKTDEERKELAKKLAALGMFPRG